MSLPGHAQSNMKIQFPIVKSTIGAAQQLPSSILAEDHSLVAVESVHPKITLPIIIVSLKTHPILSTTLNE